MSQVRLVFDGLDAFAQQLQQLPTALAEQAEAVVTRTAQAARDEVAAAYPRRVGTLADSVVVQDLGVTGPGTSAALVKNTAKHAHWFEYGTQARHSSIGARGSMPARPTFIPITRSHQREMVQALTALLRAAGTFTVVGSDAA